MSSGNGKGFDLWTYKPNAQEEAVLNDCGRAAFQRFVPATLLLGGTTLLAVKKGYLKPNRRFGAVPKVVLATCVSYIISELSVTGECAEKLKRLSDSPLADYIKSQERGGR